VRKTLNITILSATTVMIIAFLVGEFAPYYLVRIFTDDAELIKNSIIGMRITVAMFPIVGFQMVSSNFFQSIGRSTLAVFLSASRQLLILVPLLVILPRIYGALGVWCAMPISDAMAAILSFIVLRKEMKKFKKLEDKPFELVEPQNN